MQEANGVFAMSLVASVFTGVLVAFIMGYSAGPYREPFWLAV